ncbi:hypothetical protein, partial [Mesorhizobium sp.]|uniref:hypothetical protein n=1 Tax=Mesorhizobium sp. TaxID=1871066 RepID=UPI00257B2199
MAISILSSGIFRDSCDNPAILRNDYRAVPFCASAFANTYGTIRGSLSLNREHASKGPDQEEKKMRVGCPREIKNHEYRVGL